RNQRRAELQRMLRQVAIYLELTADGDVAKLSTTGFELRRDAGRGRAGGAARSAPDHGRPARRGRAERRQPAGRDRLRDPDQHRRPVRRVLIDSLPSGPVWVRVRAVSRSGNGAWTTPVSVLVG
ncbi:MAG: hypothetical protein AB9M60_22190, partial [Leptothrix sp. (in: b-proteobacteria)]